MRVAAFTPWISAVTGMPLPTEPAVSQEFSEEAAPLPNAETLEGTPLAPAETAAESGGDVPSGPADAIPPEETAQDTGN
jgi:hypothetical protein